MGTPNPLYGTGVFRRRLRWRALPGRVDVELEDSNHGFCLSLHYASDEESKGNKDNKDDTDSPGNAVRITAIDARPIRHPFTTCPEAVANAQRIVGLSPDDVSSLRERLPQADNCTHLVDMALLAASHALETPQGVWRLYDIAVDDEHEGLTRARILCDGQLIHEWLIRNHHLEAPAEQAGKPVMRGFYAWAVQAFQGMPLEAAQLLQRGYFVAQARRSVYIPIEQNPAITDGMPHNACYSYNLGAVERAQRIHGSVRDYSASADPLLRFTPSPERSPSHRHGVSTMTQSKQMAARQGALSGIKIIEFGQMVSAPFCAKLFSDYGADVIKVEPPKGDAARHTGPFPGDVPHPEKSGLYFINNTNKRSVTCDVRTEAGRQLFLRLLEGADVLIENNLPQQMRAWKLDYPTLRAVNPNLVVISITPFGQTGPYSEWNGYDLNAYHLSGASSRYCGRPGEMPLEHGTFSADYFGAITAATWGMAAVYGRALTGGGQQVDVSCAEAIAAAFIGGQNIGGYAQDGRFDKRTGVGMPQGAPATIMPCKDGHVWMLALEPGQWNGLRKVMGDPEWADLDIFQNMKTRAENADVIYSFLTEWTMEHTKMEIQEKCQAAGCPITAVYTIAEAAEQPHLKAREYFVDMEHPELGKLKNLGAPFKLPACPGGPVEAAPLLGQHNDEIYGGQLGLTTHEIQALRAQGVI